jgi:UDP-2-acetamido-3-amino-2,3-dideoxy-glucuronate N-acetyltransferase
MRAVIPRVCIVGGGYWGKNLIRVFRQLGVLHSVCDVDAQTRESLSTMYSGVRVVDSMDAVLEDKTINCIVVAVPAAQHYAIASAALTSGRDTFVEKPLALSVRDGRDLVQLAARQQAVLMVGHIVQYHPAVVRLRELIDSGELGDLLYIYSNRLNLGRVRSEENILWSFAPHDVSLILAILGELPETVSATGGAYLQDGVADVTVTNLTFGNGVRAHVFVSWLHPYKEQKLVVVGSRKMAVFDDVVPTDKLKLYDKGIVWNNGQGLSRTEPDSLIDYAPTEPLEVECRHFLECVATRAVPRTHGANAVDVLRVLEASEESLKLCGAPVSLMKRLGQTN